MRLFLTLVCLSLFSFSSLAQYSLSGRVSDEAGQGLPSATVLLLSQDSLMEEYGITNSEGEFEWKGLKGDDYILQVSFMGYSVYYQNLNLKSDTRLDSIQLTKLNFMLDAVDAEDEFIPLSIQGDTIKYKADAFYTQPNAVVEDLLKQLPGVEVESDGTIRAQGEQVQNVLVDGKRFFGDDPKMATKNLPADAVDEVQVYDKLSDMAEFTGIEDGNDEKTINLELKEGAKAGYFGEAYAGGGYDPALYEGKFNVNRFNDKSQTSVILSANNVNDQAFSIQDYIQFMGGFGALMSGGGMMMLDVSELPGGIDDGVNHTRMGGLNYNRDYGKRVNLESSYFYSGLNNYLDESAERLYVDDGPLAFGNESKDHVSNGNNHRFNYRLKFKQDSSQEWLSRGSLSFQNGFQNSLRTQGSFDSTRSLLNLFQSDNFAQRTLFSGVASLDYRKRLSKEGRNLVAEFEGSGNVDERYGMLESVNLKTGDLDQNQSFEQSTWRYGGNLRYTEPLGNGYFLQPTLSASSENISLDKDFFDLFNEVESFNSQLSNAYEVDQNSLGAGLNLQRNRDKTNLRLGLNYERAKMFGMPENMDAIEKSFSGLLPNLSFRYRIKSGMNLRLGAESRIRFPSMDELQPVVDNTNPFQIYIGNPNLEIERNFLASTSFSSFSQFSFISLFGFLEYEDSKNAIQNSVFIDSNFAQVLTPVNVDYRRVLTGSMNYQMPIRPLKVKIGLNLREQFTQTIQPINGVDNELKRFVHRLGFTVENRKKQSLDLRVGTRVSWNVSRYSADVDRNQSFVNTSYYGDFTWNIKEKWSINGNFTYFYYSSNDFQDSQAVPLLSASITRRFLKDNRGELSLRGSDLLNRNIGFSRSTGWNYIEERRTNNLGRFVMIRFAYSLKGFGQKDDVNIKIGG